MARGRRRGVVLAEVGFRGGLGRRRGDAVFVDGPAELEQGAVPQGAVVLDVAGEVVQGEGVLLGGDDAQVAGHAAVPQPHADLRGAAGEGFLHEVQGDEGGDHDLRLAGGNDHVQVVQDLLASAQGAGLGHLVDGRVLAQGGDEGAADPGDVAQAEQAGAPLPVGDALPQVLGGFLAKAGQPFHRAGVEFLLEPRQTVHLELLVEGLDLLRPQAG